MVNKNKVLKGEIMANYPNNNGREVNPNYVPPASIKRASTSKDDVIKNLYTLFDAAFEENMNGRGTDITKMVTTFIPDAIQNLQAYEDMFKNLNKHIKMKF